MNTLKNNRNFQLSLVLGATLAFSACSGDGRPLEEAVEASELDLASLRIVQPTGLLDPLVVNPGEQVSFSIIGTTDTLGIELPLSATDRRWSVNSPDLASIDENGNFTAIADGTVKVDVRVGGLLADFEVNIAQGTLTGFEISPQVDDPLERCLPQTYMATGTYTHTANMAESSTRGLPNIEWSIPDETMGSVNTELGGTATVTAFNAGTLMLDATAEGVTGTASIVVEDNLDEISISPTTLAVMESSTLQLSATGLYTRDGEPTNSDITESVNWSLPDGDAFASVSNEVPNKGLVTGRTRGITSVTATCGELPAEKELVVIENDGSGSNNLAFEGGQNRTIFLSQDQNGEQLNVSTGSVYDEDNAITFDDTTTWSVSEGRQFVEFSSVTKGLIIPLAEGTAIIRVVIDDPDEPDEAGDAVAFQTIVVRL